jgi:hypothetical protein
MERNERKIILEIYFMKGKEHLMKVFKIVENIMIEQPEKYCYVNIHADENNPKKTSCRIDKGLKLDELKILVDDIINHCDCWDFFE